MACSNSSREGGFVIRFEFFIPSKHYAEICKWWESQEWSVIPLDHLPQNGIVVYAGDVMACAAWVYKTDSAFCLLDWIVANPLVRKKERSDCLDLLFEVGKMIANELGFKTIFTTTKNSTLVSRMEKQGFEIQGETMTNLIFSIDKGVS
jgi:hypothetical protein